MRSNWEPKFSTWASSPSISEEERCENAIRAVKKAISASSKLQQRSIKVFLQGSYRNRVNIRHESDVDIGVLCHDLFIAQYPKDMAGENFGHTDGGYNITDFKDDLHRALLVHFGEPSVIRGSKALNVKENTYRVDADVVPLMEFRQYWKAGNYRAGVALWDDKARKRIENYPERLFDYWPNTPLHYENGVSKNTSTGRAFKAIVRILKKVSVEMSNSGITSANNIPSYLIECLVYNVPIYCFQGTNWSQKLGSILSYIQTNISATDWMEVDEIKYLFHDSQPWKINDAKLFISDTLSYLDNYG